MKKYSNQKGQLLIEIILAILIGALILGATANLITVSQRAGQISGEKNNAILLAQEGIEAIGSIKDNSWHNIYLPPDGTGNENSDKGDAKIYCIENDGNSWFLSGPFVPSPSIINCEINLNGIIYLRKIVIDNVHRDFTDIERKIVTSGGTQDPSTQKIKLTVSYKGGSDVVLEKYITRWRNKIFIQSNWAGGSGLLGPFLVKDRDFNISPITEYDTDDTNIDTSGGTLKLNSL
ncbi:MAG: hypothetical protein P1P85_02020 [Patescibacteria group bacterium]|nr:hypothetical protein [Patescibacteria group bacterium]